MVEEEGGELGDFYFLGWGGKTRNFQLFGDDYDMYIGFGSELVVR